MTLLKTELALPTYAGLSDADAAAALNAPIIVGNQLVALGDVKLILYTDAAPSAMLRIKAAAAVADTTVDGLQLAAQSADAYLNDPHIQHIDFTLPLVHGMLALLVAGGVLSQALSSRIQALGNVTTTRAKQLGYFGGVSAAAVHNARGVS